jgi:hypothetical protein
MPTTNSLYDSAAGGATTDIVVNQGETVTLVLYTITPPLPSIQCTVQRKLRDNSWQTVPNDRGAPGMLGAGMTEVVLGAPGIYRVQIPTTTSAVRIDEVR